MQIITTTKIRETDSVDSSDFDCEAWDYSTWIRSYSLYLEEYLECFCIMRYDFQRERKVYMLFFALNKTILDVIKSIS